MVQKIKFGSSSLIHTNMLPSKVDQEHHRTSLLSLRKHFTQLFGLKSRVRRVHQNWWPAGVIQGTMQLGVVSHRNKERSMYSLLFDINNTKQLLQYMALRRHITALSPKLRAHVPFHISAVHPGKWYLEVYRMSLSNWGNVKTRIYRNTQNNMKLKSI